jgi:hypothetical protein
MSEWGTYTLSDFLLFSPRTYYRLFELYNAAVWPAQIVAIALGVGILALVWRGGAWQGRGIAAILAAAWLWVAWAFHLERYATVSWAAEYFAAGFAIEALLLLWIGIVRSRLAFSMGSRVVERAGLGLFLFALTLQPLVGPLVGRKWSQLEVFGLAPDPTAVGTFGVLLLATGRVRWALLPVPILWCAITGATLLAMEAPDAFVPPLAGLLGLLAALWRTRIRPETSPPIRET